MKGLLHPPERIVAYLRYYPNNRGTRLRGRVRYAKVYELSERRRLLEKRWPYYLYYDEIQGRELQGVPRGDVLTLHMPKQRLMTLLRSTGKDRLETSAVELVHVLARESGLPLTSFGISGSLLVGLHRRDSDIDVVAYGADAAMRVQGTLLAEQARTGERVLARGILEAVRSQESRYFRLVVGEGRTDVLLTTG